jgi:hypothetical protein
MKLSNAPNSSEIWLVVAYQFIGVISFAKIAATMFVLILLCSLLTAPPQDKSNKNIPINHRSNQTTKNAISKVAPLIAVGSPGQQSTSKLDVDRHESSAQPGTQKIELIPQPPDVWFKGYVIFTAIIAALNLGVLVVIWRQKTVMDGQLSEMREARKQTDKLIAASKESADAAKKSADTAEMALRLSERADILLDEAGLSTGQDITTQSDVVVQFKNFGRTRAKNVTFTFNLAVAGAPKSQKKMGPMILGSGATQSVMFNLFESVVDLSRIMRNEAEMTFDGKVTYTDVFDFSHTTHASGTFDPTRRAFRVNRNSGD